MADDQLAARGQRVEKKDVLLRDSGKDAPLPKPKVKKSAQLRKKK